MMRFERRNRPLALLLRPARLGTLTSLTASLLLGACSQSSDLLPSIAMKPLETGTSETAPASPQTELQKATEYWGKEYAKKPTELQPALNYARDLKAMGEKQKAYAVLQQASTLHTDSRELAGEYGRLALDLNQVGAANQLLTIADDPTKPDWRVISARGTVMAKQGKYSDAIPFYERALTLSPKNPTVMNNLAMAHAMMGDPKKAEEILRQAVTEDGATPKVRENLAIVLGLQGRYDEFEGCRRRRAEFRCRISQHHLSEANGEARCEERHAGCAKLRGPDRRRSCARSACNGKQDGRELGGSDVDR